MWEKGISMEQENENNEWIGVMSADYSSKIWWPWKGYMKRSEFWNLGEEGSSTLLERKRNV